MEVARTVCSLFHPHTTVHELLLLLLSCLLACMTATLSLIDRSLSPSLSIPYSLLVEVLSARVRLTRPQRERVSMHVWRCLSRCVAPSRGGDGGLAVSRRLFASASRAAAVPSSANATNTPGQSERDRILRFPYAVVDTAASLAQCVQSLQGATEVAVDVEALVSTGDAITAQLGPLSLVQLCSDASPQIFLVDVLTLGVARFSDGLGPILTNEGVRKFFFDCRRDVEALSCQAHIRPHRVVDLQLYYTALQWRLRSVNRRSGMPYVLKAMTGLERKETDSAVHLAMTCGARPVWDVRPLAAHFLNYAADDVRHTYLLRAAFASALTATRSRSSQVEETESALITTAPCPVPVHAVERLTEHYVAHYARGVPVEQEADPRPAEVNVALLERYIGPGGVCRYCGMKGHVESECFQKKQVGASHARRWPAHEATTSDTPPRASRGASDGFGEQKYPRLLKCGYCNRLGHNEENCFKKHPCKQCGGEHHSDLCRHRLRTVPYFGCASNSHS